MVYVLPCGNFNNWGDIFYDRIKLCFNSTVGADIVMGRESFLI